MTKVPRATYRLQLRPEFGLEQASLVMPYLAELGASHVYASPVFKARTGSAHGYDVVDPNVINPELGGEQGLDRALSEAAKNGLSWLQDIVPNHMAYDNQNRMLMDIFENGLDSPFKGFFDIDWDHPSESIRGRVLAPFLGRFYAECLEDGEIQLSYDKAGLTVNYYDLCFPLRFESYRDVFTMGISELEEEMGRDHPDLIKFLGIIYTFTTLGGEGPPARKEQYESFAKDMLYSLYERSESIQKFMDGRIVRINGTEGDPKSFDLLDRLLSDQLFRLSFWKVANEEINYRRFFTINELICVRVEDRQVYDCTHFLINKLVSEKGMSGLRVDHVDGLYDPESYLSRLRQDTGDAYLVVEKILGHDEKLPGDWPIQGTTGYDFMNRLNAVFVDRPNEKKMTGVYDRFTGIRQTYREIALEKKRLILGKHLAGNIDNLANLLAMISSTDRYGRDITLYGLRRALVEVMAHFPVYRTYISPGHFSEQDRRYAREAIQDARKEGPGLAYELNFIEKFLMMAERGDLSPEERDQAMKFVMGVQQLTGPLMAKGFEDTFLYVYNRLVSLNDVGGHPDIFGEQVGEFHKFCEERAERAPNTMNATATHDTKRGEDVRARINVISEMPQRFDSMIKQWRKINSGKKKKIAGRRAPDRNDEYFLYQTLLGTFPWDSSEMEDYIERIEQYLVKAVREAKVHTAWLKPDEHYEEAFTSFARGALEDEAFLESFVPFQKDVSWYGALNSLSQVIIKATAPGLPDFYQGTELWDLSLVDPDNRRPVDYEKRRGLLGEIKKTYSEDPSGTGLRLLNRVEDGSVKLFLVHRALSARTEMETLFSAGEYIPLSVRGDKSDHIIAFARRLRDDWAITAATRLHTGLAGPEDAPLGEEVWRDTCIELPEKAPTKWEDLITGRSISADGKLPLSEALEYFPGAILKGA